MAEFICMGGVKLRGSQSKGELQNDQFLPTVGFQPMPITALELEGRCLIYMTTESGDQQRLKVKIIFTCAILYSLNIR